MKRFAAWLLLCCLSLLLTVPVFAHPGKTDASGGHYDRSTGEYHYHHGFPAHQHTDGVCPYDFIDKTGENSDGSSSYVSASNGSQNSMRVGPPVTGTSKSIREQYKKRQEAGYSNDGSEYGTMRTPTLDDIRENYQRIMGKTQETSSEEYETQIEQLQTALNEASKELDILHRILTFETAAVIILAILFIGFSSAARRRKKELKSLQEQFRQQKIQSAGLQQKLEESHVEIEVTDEKAAHTTKKLQRTQAEKYGGLIPMTTCSKCGNQFEGNFCPNCGVPAQQPPKVSPLVKAVPQKAVPKKHHGTGMKVLIWILTCLFLIMLNVYIGMTVGIRLGQFLLDVLILFAGRNLCKLWDRHLEKKFGPSSQGAEQESQKNTVYEDGSVYIHLAKISHYQKAGQFFLNATLDIRNKSTAPLSLSYVLFDSTGREISPSEFPISQLPAGDTSTTINVYFRPPVSNGTLIVTANSSVAAFDFTI